MNAKNWFKYDIMLLILWTAAFIAGLFGEDAPSLLSYCLIYGGLVCENLKHITKNFFINKRINSCSKECKDTHSCDNCNTKDCE